MATSARRFDHDDLYELQLAGEVQVAPDGATLAFAVYRADRDTDATGSRIHIASTEKGDVRRLTNGPNDRRPRWSPDGARLAFLRMNGVLGGDVWVMPVDGGEPVRVTGNGTVSEFEWSPDGTRLLFVALVDVPDEAGRTKPFVHGLPLKMDGGGVDVGARPHLFVVDAREGAQANQLTQGDFIVGTPTWAPSGDRIAFTTSMHETRGVDLESHLFVVPADGGEVRQVTQGNEQVYSPAWVDDSRIVCARRAELRPDTLVRLCVVDVETGAYGRCISEPLDRSVYVQGGFPGQPSSRQQAVDGGTAVLFAVNRGGTVVLYRGAIDGDDEPVPVVEGDLVVESFHSGGGVLAFSSSSADVPADVFVAEADGPPRRITDLNEELLGSIELPTVTRREFTAPDGTPVEGWVMAHEDAAAGPRPLLLDIHGGPHGVWTVGFPPFALYRLALAAAGWVVLYVNPRGSDGYGQEFMRGVLGAWGEADMPDFMAAVDTLVDEGIADPERLAVAGYSYGGYMTNWLVTQTDRFKAAVTGGCVSDIVALWGTGDIGGLFTSTEMEGEFPAHAERYRALSPISHVDRVRTPTLILHGDADQRCPIGQAEAWFTALRRHGQTAELVRYPGGSHLFIVTGRPSHRVDFSRRLVDWVRRYADPGSGL